MPATTDSVCRVQLFPALSTLLTTPALHTVCNYISQTYSINFHCNKPICLIKNMTTWSYLIIQCFNEWQFLSTNSKIILIVNVAYNSITLIINKNYKNNY